MQTDIERIETEITDLNQQYEVLDDPGFDIGKLQREISGLEEILEKLHQESFD